MPAAAALSIKRVADVVAVPDVGKLQPPESTEPVVQGQQVAQRLDGVKALGERVVDRHGGSAHEDDEIVVGGETSGDAIDVATENLRGVGQGLAARELEIVRTEKGRVAAKLLHAGLEGIAGAGAGMLEEHAQRLPSQVRVRLRRAPAGS